MEVNMNFKLFATIILVVYCLIPIILILNSFKVVDKNVKKNRIKYAVPSIIVTIFNIGFIIYYNIVKPGDIFHGNKFLIFGVPIILLAICIISSKTGKLKERYLVASIGASTVEKTNLPKGSSRNRVSFSSGNEEFVKELEQKEQEENKEEEIETL